MMRRFLKNIRRGSLTTPSPYIWASEKALTLWHETLKNTGTDVLEKVMYERLCEVATDIAGETKPNTPERINAFKEEYFALNVMDYHKSLAIMYMIKEGLLEEAGSYLDDLDTSPREYLLGLMKKYIHGSHSL